MKIITALGNQKLNMELRKNKLFDVISTDVQYQEALMEIIENRKDCDILVISELLYGEKSIKELVINILKINSKISIIVFLEKENDELRMFLISIGVYKIFINNQIKYEELSQVLQEKYLPQNYIETNSLIKIEEKNEGIVSLTKKILDKVVLVIKNIKLKIIKKSNNHKEVIAIAGISGSGKSTFSALIADYLKNIKRKTVIVDFNVFNNSINTIFGVKKYPKNFNEECKIDNVNDLIIKINDYLSLICGIDSFFTEGNIINEDRIKNMINVLEEKYDVILFDLSSDIYFRYCEILLNCANKVLFLIDPNLLEIKKSLKLIKTYTEEWNIERDKIFLILNKVNANSIDDKIVKCIFSEYKMLQKFNYSNYYNLSFNNNLNNLILSMMLKNKIRKLI